MIHFRTEGDNIVVTKANGDIVTVPASATIKENCCTASVYLRFDNPANDFQIDFHEQVSIDGAAPVTGVDDIGSALADIFTVASEGGAAAWGDITGTLGDQTDLDNILDNLSNTIGNKAGLNAENTFTESQNINKDHAGPTTLTVANLHVSGYAGSFVYGASQALYSEADETLQETKVGPSSGSGQWFIFLRTFGTGHATTPERSQLAIGAGHLHINMNGTDQAIIPEGGIQDYADDAAAAASNVPVNGWYRTGSVLKIRVS